MDKGENMMGGGDQKTRERTKVGSVMITPLKKFEVTCYWEQVK